MIKKYTIKSNAFSIPIHFIVSNMKGEYKYFYFSCEIYLYHKH